jgi:hypothetical protein
MQGVRDRFKRYYLRCRRNAMPVPFVSLRCFDRHALRSLRLCEVSRQQKPDKTLVLQTRRVSVSVKGDRNRNPTLGAWCLDGPGRLHRGESRMLAAVLCCQPCSSDSSAAAHTAGPLRMNAADFFQSGGGRGRHRRSVSYACCAPVSEGCLVGMSSGVL